MRVPNGRFLLDMDSLAGQCRDSGCLRRYLGCLLVESGEGGGEEGAGRNYKVPALVLQV